MNSRTWMVMSLLITCLLAGFALSEVYAVTKPKVEQQKIDATNSALAQVLATAQTFKEVEEDSLWYGLDQSGTKTGIVVRSGRRGYGGPGPGLIGLDLTGRIIGVKVEDLKETPGLGLKAREDWFGRQFIGLDSTVALKKEGGTIDAISGATITSRAAARGVAQAIRKYSEHLKP
jgi:Na+-translocating ferredoxin:NAD+ oxidoreductase subunit G